MPSILKEMPAYCKRLAHWLVWGVVFVAAWMPMASAQAAQKILVMGDSLSAEYGIAKGQGWVDLLGRQWQSGQTAAVFVNASISGETTIGGRTRLPKLLQQHQPDLVVIELGANDALRGLDIRSTRDNLNAMIQASRQAGAQVLLIGMQVPPNYGKRYTQDFAQTFADAAQANQVALMPFLLKDVADRPDSRDWFQPDGLHPLAKAHPLIAQNVATALRPLLVKRR